MSNYDNSNSNGGVGTMNSKSLVENSALREAENEDIRNQIAKVKKNKIVLHIPILSEVFFCIYITIDDWHKYLKLCHETSC